MGCGKSKAKQTKVARELKYGSSASNLTALEDELKRKGSQFFSEPDSIDLSALRVKPQ